VDELSPLRRPVARVLLFDEDGRILLLHDPDGYWYTPGGGIEPGETAEQAALRELREELGIAAELGPMILRRRTEFDVRGHHLDQDEWHFVGRLRRDVAWEPGSADGERAAVAASRWWTLDEVRASSERFFPDGLAELLELEVASVAGARRFFRYTDEGGAMEGGGAAGSDETCA
jgi:8-oxo-dGTP pyrophosphatase MutT (NUDIX family)